MKKFIHKNYTKICLFNFLLLPFIAFINSNTLELVRLLFAIIYFIYIIIIFFINEEEKNKVSFYYYNSVSTFRLVYDREPTEEEDEKLFQDALNRYYNN